MSPPSCDEIQEAILDEAVDPDPVHQAALEEHLRACPGCRAAAEGVACAVDRIRTVPLPDPGPLLASGVRSALATRRSASSRTGHGPTGSLPRVGVIAASVAALAVTAIVLWPAPASSWQIAPAGTVRAGARTLTRATSIAAGANIEVPAGSRAMLSHPGVRLLAEGASRLTALAPDRVRLDAGVAWVEVARGQSFRLDAGILGVDVRGTRFRVAVTDSGVRLDVHEGAVQARAADGDAVLAAAGDAYVFRNGAPTVRESIPRSDGWPAIPRGGN